jgi:hypothetical protein
VCEGDSGAWVAHSAAPEVYGHVVATDILGDAYVTPSVDTFQEIKECMGAKSVRLPCGGSIICAETDIATNCQTMVTPISLEPQKNFRYGQMASAIPQIDSVSDTIDRLPSVDCASFGATFKSPNMDMQELEPANNVPSLSYPERRLSGHVVDQTTSSFDVSEDKTQDISSLEPIRYEVDSAVKTQKLKSLTSSTPPFLRLRNRQGMASAESTSSDHSWTPTPAMDHVGLNMEQSYRGCYAKHWDPVFAKDRSFKYSDRSHVQLKRTIGHTGDGVDLFFQDSESFILDDEVEEIREFCKNVPLEDLKAGRGWSGQQRSAWLDERSRNSQTREHKNPLTATELYKRLNTPVRDSTYV